MKNLPRGYTLIELLVVISIISFLFTIGVVSYRNFNRRQLVNQAALKIAEGLRMAQSLARNNQKTCSGVLEGYKFVVSGLNFEIQECCSGSCNEVKEEQITSSSEISLGGFTEVKFKILRQGIDCEIPCELNVSGFGNSKTIVVDPGGSIEIK